MFFREDPSKKILKTMLKLIDDQILGIYRQAIRDLLRILDMMKNRRFSEAAGYVAGLTADTDLLKKTTKMFITKQISTVYETDAVTSFSAEDIEQRRQQVVDWLDETSGLARTLRQSLRKASRNPTEIAQAYSVFEKLSDRINEEQYLVDLVNSLRAISAEYSMWLLGRDRSSLIFESLKLHRGIRRVSKKPFELGDYNVSVFEAFKELERLVRKKSGRKHLYGIKLMGNVFSEENPVLRLSTRDEQIGFKFMFMGAMAGIRNIGAHGAIKNLDLHKTLEHLSFASLLVRKLDEAAKVG